MIFTIFTPLQGSLIASRDTTRPTIPLQQDSPAIVTTAIPVLDPQDLHVTSSLESDPLSLSNRVRRLSLQAHSLRRQSQTLTDLDNLTMYQFVPSSDPHDPCENSKNSHPSSDSEQKKTPRIFPRNRRSIVFNDDTAQKESTSKSNKDLHITISRNQLHLIECFCLLAGTSFGVYCALKPTSTQKRSSLIDFDTNTTEITRGGIPTDMIGAGFWGFNKLSGLASSGVTLVLAGFMLHKIKGWVDTIYASDTDRRIDKKLNPVISNVSKLAQYVDEELEQIDVQFVENVKTINRLINEQAKLTDLLQEETVILEVLTQDYEKRNPADAKAQEIMEHVNTLHAEVAATMTDVQALQKEAETKKSELPRKNPITLKEQSAKCCGICKQQ